MNMSNRVDLAELCNGLGLGQYAVEVGTDQGVFARAFLSKWTGYQLICVDPWEPYDEMPWARDVDLAFAIHNLAPFSSTGRVRIVQHQQQAANIVAQNNGRLDFCYIDADHHHCDIDIAFWWPLVSSGGILAGHDYHEIAYPSLVAAVNKLRDENSLELNIISEPTGSSWWVRKP